MHACVCVIVCVNIEKNMKIIKTKTSKDRITHKKDKIQNKKERTINKQIVWIESSDRGVLWSRSEACNCKIWLDYR